LEFKKKFKKNLEWSDLLRYIRDKLLLWPHFQGYFREVEADEPFEII